MIKTKMLKKNKEFSYVFSKGVYFSGNTIEAFVLKNKNSYNYLGLAISVKSGYAYQRNRLKRILRENYRYFEKDIKDGVSIVFLLKKKANIKDVSFDCVKLDMQIIFEKAELFKS